MQAHPMEGHCKFEGERGGDGLKANINFKGTSEAKLEFPEGWGGVSNKQKPLRGSLDNFHEQHNTEKKL